jgi:hypothetical protein
LEEIAKYPPDLFVNMKLHGIILFVESFAVRTPTVAPVGALAAIVKLLIVIVMDLSAAQFVRKRKHRRLHARMPATRPSLLMYQR